MAVKILLWYICPSTSVFIQHTKHTRKKLFVGTVSEFLSEWAKSYEYYCQVESISIVNGTLAIRVSDPLYLFG
ncbi:MAG: hypothetical protein FWB72_01465 [Firmicutes bacterium]|nr:hypothetical protein [Bacillota bacterium]